MSQEEGMASEATLRHAGAAGAKCRLTNARPEPDLRYFSKRTASASVGNLGLRRDSLALDRERRLAGCSGRFPQLIQAG